MVTDLARKKILFFGGIGALISNTSGEDPYGLNAVWEWDGAALTWTKRTSPTTAGSPAPRTDPVLTFDDARGKLFLFEGLGYTFDGVEQHLPATAYREWDPVTADWAYHDTGDALPAIGLWGVGAYDSIRRRQVVVSSGQTWEIDTRTRTLCIRTTATIPDPGSDAHMVFDSVRGVMVLDTGSETWEYKVRNLGNGEGCTVASTSWCASGFCVDGVCCDVGACTGVCQSCAVAGSEGTCASAAPGTIDAGACAADLACDGTGSCKRANGQPCTGTSVCASGFCADGVCCDSACTGTCVSCIQRRGRRRRRVFSGRQRRRGGRLPQIRLRLRARGRALCRATIRDAVLAGHHPALALAQAFIGPRKLAAPLTVRSERSSIGHAPDPTRPAGGAGQRQPGAIHPGPCG